MFITPHHFRQLNSEQFLLWNSMWAIDLLQLPSRPSIYDPCRTSTLALWTSISCALLLHGSVPYHSLFKQTKYKFCGSVLIYISNNVNLVNNLPLWHWMETPSFDIKNTFFWHWKLSFYPPLTTMKNFRNETPPITLLHFAIYIQNVIVCNHI